MELAAIPPSLPSSQNPSIASTMMMMPKTTNVQVAVRIRPLSARQRQAGASECIQLLPGLPQLIAPPDRSFTFDAVLGPAIGQPPIFEEFGQPLVDAFLEGFNGTLLAYGQTGSGKTFTMGTGIDGSDESIRGLIPRSVAYLLTRLQGCASEGREWELFVSFLEIYNEEIIDLLGTGGRRTGLSIREGGNGEIYLPGIREESLKRTNASGDRAKESISINSGLLALGNVISALGDESKHATHIPYRDSKLTRLLQDSLGGNSRTVMIACISPADDDLPETLNTLKYANRARNIKNRVCVNEDANGNAAFEIIQLKKQVAALKQELLQLRTSKEPRRLTRSESAPLSPLSTLGNGKNDRDLGRLQAANIDLKRRLDATVKEKIAIEAERDYLRAIHESEDPGAVSVIKQHLMTISQLRNKILEHENGTYATGTNRATSTPVRQQVGGPDWMFATKALVDRARQEISDRLDTIDNLRVSEDLPEDINMDPAQFLAAVQTRVDALIEPLKADLSLQEEMAQSLQNLQAEYQAMQGRYNERIRLLSDNIAVLQKQPASSTTTKTSESDKLGRTRYEERIKRMGKEINELKDRLEQQSKAQQTRSTSSESTLRSLRQLVQQLKTERARLQSQLTEETAASRTRRQQHDTEVSAELAELRARERKALEAARKWRKAYDFQKAMLQRRIEQCTLARSKIRSMVSLLRRHRIRFDNGSPTNGGGGGFDTPGWRQIMQTPSISVSASRTVGDNINNNTNNNRNGAMELERDADGDYIMDNCMTPSYKPRVHNYALDEDTDALLSSRLLRPVVHGQQNMMESAGDHQPQPHNHPPPPHHPQLQPSPSPSSQSRTLVNTQLSGILKRLQQTAGTPKSRLAFGWVPTEQPLLSPDRPKPRDFFAQIADAASLSLRASAVNPFIEKHH